MDLTDAERLLLDFEREWWQLPATKMSEIRARFGFSASSYYRSLHLLVDRPDEVNDPALAARMLCAYISDRAPGMRQLLENDDLVRARKLVNGGSHGLNDFKAAYDAILPELRAS